MKLPGFLEKDSFVLGFVVGILLPVVFYFFLLVVDQLVLALLNRNLTHEHHLLYLLSTIVNLLPVRYYLIKLKLEKTGLGILAITAMLILAYFFLFFNQ